MAELKVTVAQAPQGTQIKAEDWGSLTKVDVEPDTATPTTGTDAEKAAAKAKQEAEIAAKLEHIGAGDTFLNPAARTTLTLYNEDSNAVDVYLIPGGKPAGLSLAHETLSVPPKGIRVVGPFDPAVYNNAGGSVGLATQSDKIKYILIQTP